LKEVIFKGKSTLISIKDAIQRDKIYSKSLLDYKHLSHAGVAVFISTFLIVFVDGLIWSFEPLYTTYGIDTATVGIIMSMFFLPFILFSVPAGYIADKIGRTKVFTSGLLCAAVFLISFGLTRDPALLMISAFATATGLALARPAMEGFLTEISSGKERGGIVGVWNVAEDSAYVASPIIGGAIAEAFGLGSAFISVGSLLILSVPFIYLAIRNK
jgi:MFS family permease